MDQPPPTRLRSVTLIVATILVDVWVNVVAGLLPKSWSVPTPLVVTVVIVVGAVLVLWQTWAERAPGPRAGRASAAAVVVAALVLFVPASAGTGYLFYRAAMAGASPADVLQAYLSKKLNERNEQSARAMECARPQLDQVDALAADLRDRATRFHVSIDVQTFNMTTSRVTPTTADVETSLEIRALATGGQPEGTIEAWVFHLAREGSWRVCAANLTAP